jgi:hypothetical protein
MLLKNSWVSGLRLSKIIDVLGFHVDVIKNDWFAGFKGYKNNCYVGLSIARLS